MRYIELNPVRAGMVAHPGDYPWSSYRHHAQGEPGVNADWLTAHEEYLRLGRNEADRQSAYRELFQAAISSKDLAEIRECTHKGWALGGERFKEQIEALGQRRAVSGSVRILLSMDLNSKTKLITIHKQSDHNIMHLFYF